MKRIILNVPVDTTDYSAVTRQVKDWACARESRTVIAANVHVVMEAHDREAYENSINSADLITPDGMPLVWMLRLKGAKGQERVYGPTLMLHVLEMAAQEGVPVGFYGAAPETLDRLVSRMSEHFPGLKVVYAFSPPFRELSDIENDQVVDEIVRSGVRILFVGLGCPKQETWMAEQKGKIPAVMLGVGAAFDFAAGSKPQAPRWMQAMGLEWIYRLFHEPRRLAQRYFRNNPRFVLLALADLLGFPKIRRREA